MIELGVWGSWRLGQVLAERPKINGSRGVGKRVEMHNVTPPTLSELGTEKTNAKRNGVLYGNSVQTARGYAYDAERKMGQMLKNGDDRAGRGKPKQNVPDRNTKPTRPELGLTRKESSRAQLLADLPKPVFEAVKTGSKTRTEAPGPAAVVECPHGGNRIQALQALPLSWVRSSCGGPALPMLRCPCAIPDSGRRRPDIADGGEGSPATDRAGPARRGGIGLVVTRAPGE
jgi:hypothetical protein